MTDEAAAPAPPPLGDVLRHLRREPSRTWSIVVTVFGDVVVPRGGSIWLGSLLEVFAAMDVGAGVVRTAMSRLTAGAWLERERAGRNSFYRLGARGRASFADAEALIYGPPPPPWDGRFALELSDAPPPGFVALAPGVWIAARTEGPPGELRLEASAEPEAARRLAARVWPVAETGQAYGRFLDAFAPLASSRAPAGIDALVARILLIHQYRRVVLRDPRLPAALLPDPWPGAEARAVCAATYRALAAPSEAWLDAHARREDGPLPPPSIDLSRRFAPASCYEKS